MAEYRAGHYKENVEEALRMAGRQPRRVFKLVNQIRRDLDQCGVIAMGSVSIKTVGGMACFALLVKHGVISGTLNEIDKNRFDFNFRLAEALCASGGKSTVTGVVGALFADDVNGLREFVFRRAEVDWNEPVSFVASPAPLGLQILPLEPSEGLLTVELPLLHAACLCGAPKCLTFFSANHVKFDVDALECAAAGGNAEVIRPVLEQSSGEVPDSGWVVAASSAAALGDGDQLLWFLEQAGELSVQDFCRVSSAARAGESRLCRAILGSSSDCKFSQVLNRELRASDLAKCVDTTPASHVLACVRDGAEQPLPSCFKMILVSASLRTRVRTLARCHARFTAQTAIDSVRLSGQQRVNSVIAFELTQITVWRIKATPISLPGSGSNLVEHEILHGE
jgi:hypothetical protein